MRLYLAGPMTGYPGMNYQAFHDAAAKLRAMGHFVCSPAELNPPDRTYRQALPNDLTWIFNHAEGIVYLDGWEESRGCAVEHALARCLELPEYALIEVLHPVEVDEALTHRDLP